MMHNHPLVLVLFFWSLAVAAPLDTAGFTLGIWSVPNAAIASLPASFDIVANPFNTSDPAKAAVFLDTCEKYGRTGIVGVDCQSLGDAAYLANLAAVTRDHPAASAIMLYDEPLTTSSWCSPVSVDQCAAAYATLKSVDSLHPVFIDDFQTAQPTNPVDDYKGAYDFFTSDYYTICDDGTLKLYREALEYYYAAVAPKSWIALIQLHGMAGTYFRTPTPQQERVITYMPIVAGARGIMFYSYEGEANAVDFPELWSYVQRLSAELKTLQPILAAPNIAGGVEVTGSSGKIFASVKQFGESLYLIACNYAHTGTLANTAGNPVAQAASSVTFTVNGIDAGQVRTIGTAGLVASEASGRTLTLSQGSFTDAMDPFAVHVYEIVPEGSSIIDMRAGSLRGSGSVTLTRGALSISGIPVSTRMIAEIIDCRGRVVFRGGSAGATCSGRTLSWQLPAQAVRSGVWLVRIVGDGGVMSYRVVCR